jgi:hypothetical protein
MRLSGRVDELTDGGRAPIADRLRPFYIEYLRRHGVTADSGTCASCRARGRPERGLGVGGC